MKVRGLFSGCDRLTDGANPLLLDSAHPGWSPPNLVSLFLSRDALDREED